MERNDTPRGSNPQVAEGGLNPIEESLENAFRPSGAEAGSRVIPSLEHRGGTTGEVERLAALAEGAERASAQPNTDAQRQSGAQPSTDDAGRAGRKDKRKKI